MAFNYSPKIITDGLVLYLDAANTKSYLSGSTTWSDLSRSGNIGTLYNSPTFNSSNGGSITFDGTNDFALIPDNASLNFGTGDFTIIVWVSGISAYPGSGGKTLIRKGGKFDGNLAGWSITWASSPADLYFIVSSDSARLETRSNPAFSYNGWSGYKMIGLRRTSGTIAQINNTTITSGGTFTGNVNNTNSVEISYNSFYAGFGNTYLADTVGIVQLYNRSLTSQELLQNYNALKSRFGL
jgi:hypothetical protein